MLREKIDRIEMTDEEWIESRKPKIIAKHAEIEHAIQQEANEPQKNERATKKTPKVHRKAHKTAVASIQKKR